jgi:small subunit ribosomal protein S17
MTETKKKSLKRTLIGKVVGDKRTKTVTVLIERRVSLSSISKIVGKVEGSIMPMTKEVSTSWVMSSEITESRPILQDQELGRCVWLKKPRQFDLCSELRVM